MKDVVKRKLGYCHAVKKNLDLGICTLYSNVAVCRCTKPNIVLMALAITGQGQPRIGQKSTQCSDLQRSLYVTSPKTAIISVIISVLQLLNIVSGPSKYWTGSLDKA